MSKAKTKRTTRSRNRTYDVLALCQQHGERVEIASRKSSDDSITLQGQLENLLALDGELSSGFAKALAGSEGVILTVKCDGEELSWEDIGRVIQLFVEKRGEISRDGLTIASATLRPDLTGDLEAWSTETMSAAVPAGKPEQGRAETTSPHSIEDLTAMLRECSLAGRPEALNMLQGNGRLTPEDASKRLRALRQQRQAESQAILPVYQKILDAFAGQQTDSLKTNEERVQLVNTVRSDYGIGLRLGTAEDQPRVTLTLDRNRPNGGRFMAKSTETGRATRYAGRKFPELIAEIMARHTPENLPRTGEK